MEVVLALDAGGGSPRSACWWTGLIGPNAPSLQHPTPGRYIAKELEVAPVGRADYEIFFLSFMQAMHHFPRVFWRHLWIEKAIKKNNALHRLGRHPADRLKAWSGLSGRHKPAFDLDWNSRTHNFEQDADPAAIIEAIQYSELLGEWTGCKANTATDFYIFLEAKKTLYIDRSNHRFYNAARHWMGHVALHYQA
jgi:hypothetical protein